MALEGGNVVFNAGDTWLGKVTLTSGTLNYADLTSNGLINATGGKLNISSGVLTLVSGSYIDNNTIIDFAENLTLELQGGRLDINDNDSLNGLINATSGTLNVSNITITNNMFNIAQANNSNVYLNLNSATVNLVNDSVNNTYLGVISSTIESDIKFDIDLF